MLLGVVAIVGVAGLLFGAATVVEGRPGIFGGQPQRIGYFADWNTANRGFRIKDVDDSGAAARLTRVMWAFGDVSAQGTCHIPAGSSQAWEIYQRRYSAADSVDGRADDYDQPLSGSLNQLRKLRGEHPELGASISLGGWNWSDHFSDAALTEESRERFVSSCIDLWLRGDFPRMGGEPQGGDGAAAGVFDGIDLDWEWPGGGGHPDNTERPEDKRNFTLLVQEFRRQLDALEDETGEEYTLSVSLSHDPELMRAGYEPELFDSVDFATVQGYDFTGSWSDTTQHHSQLYAPEGAAGRASADLAVRTYLDYGLPADKLVLGFPGFGRGWSGVGSENFGRHAPATGPADGDYGEGTDAYADLQQRPGQRFFDPVNGAYWIYDGDEWWTYDTPEVVALKGAYVRDMDLGGLMLWNLDMDPGGELVTAMDESLRDD
ncbi:glycoside hydrolase family 18 protein [Marinactinospora thermotolerans]|uniref:chitinase n=1 Tax=Marinactinospora thermotolerans DSM 45154 TaxID=1122192 RepID=A0A1T4LS47_9ACTN|nr:glycoside hydrolase family 18 protein [Marinactinospora thermotolerans]SJZ57552.1 chitinase family 18 [Marinactinospora thermotolerans DSM 45154]